ncbi:dihydrodipicolinate synthase family protein [Nitrospinota bacterium]
MEYTKREAKQYARENMHGIWGANTYPFKKDLELDEKGLLSDLRHFIDVLQMKGLYMGGVLEEFWTQTVEERKRAQELLIREAAGAIRTVTNTGHHCIKSAIELSKHAEEVGADFISLLNPYYAAETPELIFDYFKTIADAVDIGILVLNNPSAGYVLSPSQVEQLAAEIDNICAIKNVGGFEHTNEIRRRVGDEIVVSDPKEENWLVNLVHHGQQVYLSSAAVHIYQWEGHLPMNNYTEHAMAGRIEKAMEISATMEPLRHVAKTWLSGFGGIPPIPQLKYWQSLMGLAGGYVRPPLRDMTEKDKEAFRKDLESAGLAIAAKAEA